MKKMPEAWGIFKKISKNICYRWAISGFFVSSEAQYGV
jgi:hypothetical protein